MKTKLLGILLLAGGSLFAASHFSVAVGVGPAYGYYAPPPAYYAPPPVAVYSAPPPPPYYAPPAYVRPGYSWVAGYWYPSGPRWAWQGGYWAARPYPRANWVAPRYYGGHYYRGYWR
jgi:hypothetical protein